MRPEDLWLTNLCLKGSRVEEDVVSCSLDSLPRDFSCLALLRFHDEGHAHFSNSECDILHGSRVIAIAINHLHADKSVLCHRFLLFLFGHLNHFESFKLLAVAHLINFGTSVSVFPLQCYSQARLHSVIFLSDNARQKTIITDRHEMTRVFQVML